MIGAVATSLAGLRSVSERFEQTASAVASGRPDPVQAVVDTLAAQDGVALNVAVLRSALDMQKRVLDILV